MSTVSKKRDFTEGPLFFRITLFALPIMLTGLLQVAYGMADNIVVGKFSPDPNALAALGSTGAINTMIINLLLGIAAGTGVVVSQFFGAKEYESVSKSVHTSMLISLIGGLLFMTLGLVLSRPALELLDTKEEIIDLATLYIRIICIGVPATSVYNFGASILRATGNSRAPLFILGTTGLANVLLNLIFVIGFGMSVDGVGIATVVSQYLSAIAVVVLLMKRRSEPYGLKLRSLAIDKKMMLRILKLGLPAGIQSSMFSIANMVMINAINTFPTATVTGYTVASNIDGVVFTAMSGFGQAAMTFTGQNYGARKPDRIKKSMLYSMLQELIVATVVAAIEFILMHQLIGLYVDDAKAEAEAIRAAASSIMTVMLLSMPISAIQDSLSGILKGLGYSVFAMVSGLVGICGVRMIWIWCFFPMERFHTLGGLYLSFPISWGIASLMMAVCAVLAYRKLKIKFARQEAIEGAPDRVE